MTASGTYTLEDYTNSLIIGRSEYPAELNGKVIDKSLGLNALFNRSEKAKELVAEIEAARIKCPTIKDLIFGKKGLESFYLVASDKEEVESEGRHSFDPRWAIRLGDFMFLRAADLVVCKMDANYATLDEWAKFMGQMLKPVAVSSTHSDRQSIPLYEMPFIKKWLYLSFSLLKELAKNPFYAKYKSVWSDSAFVSSDTLDKKSGLHLFKHPPGYEPIASSRQILCHTLQAKDVIHPVYFLPLSEFKPKKRSVQSNVVDNWGLPVAPNYKCTCGKSVIGETVETQYVRGLKAKKIKDLTSLKMPGLSDYFNIFVSLEGTTDPGVFRSFRIPSCYRLSSVAMYLEAIMGWNQDRFAYVFNDEDGAVFGPVKSQALDSHLLHDFQGPVSLSDNSGMIDDRTVSLGHVLREEGDRIAWTHNLKSKWVHILELGEVYDNSLVCDDDEGPVTVFGGKMRCPPEDGGGNSVYAKRMQSLSSRERDSKKEQVWKAYQFFDEGACHRRVAALTASPRYKNHLEEIKALDRLEIMGIKVPTAQEQRRPTKSADEGSKKNSSHVDRVRNFMKERGITLPKEIDTPSNLLQIAQSSLSSDKCSMCADCIMDAIDRIQRKCAVCGSKDKVHLCTGCRSVWYCSELCQKKDWKKDHKYECAGSPHFMGKENNRTTKAHKTHSKTVIVTETAKTPSEEIDKPCIKPTTPEQKSDGSVKTPAKRAPWPPDAIPSKFEASLTDEIMEKAMAKLRAMVVREEAAEAADAGKASRGDEVKPAQPASKKAKSRKECL